ncbi:MAG: PorP/SprF family type IX secretion system membrane protein [Maribacter sp.]|nr:PorP/SprF family type IX secretion system membrane protein [Maribacter sp.]
MQRTLLLFLLILFSNEVFGQEVRLPADLRQHNLVTYNASLFNPAFSLDRNEPESVAFWTRWQWQSIDSDPTTLFLNYTRRIDGRSAAGAAFFQQNTGVYFNTGGVINYAYAINFNATTQLAFGVNLFGFKQKLADDRFVIDPNIPLPQLRVSNDFILQMAPGIRLSVLGLSFSVASENLFDYNFALNESNTDRADKIFMGMLSYDFPITMKEPNAYFRPSLYLRTLPGEANQIGINTLFNTRKYWAQLGYNNFYGVGIGGGATLFERLSLGALAEFGTSASINTKKPSFEIMAAYFLGTPEERFAVTDYNLELAEKPILTDQELQDEKLKENLEKEQALAAQEKAKETERLNKANEKKVKDSLANLKEAEAVVLTRKDRRQQRDSLALAQNQKLEQGRLQDSINRKKEADAIVAAQRRDLERKQDSLNQIKIAEEEAIKKQAELENLAQQEADKPKTDEKYEEVKSASGIEPGYYLIANVFGTKKYYEAFMKDLTAKGLQPNSFVTGPKNYNYVYLGRYDTMGEARKARDSKLGGKYPDKTWIFRVIGN